MIRGSRPPHLTAEWLALTPQEQQDVREWFEWSLGLEVEVTNRYLRETLETLAGEAGISLEHEDGAPLRNFQLVDALTRFVQSAEPYN